MLTFFQDTLLLREPLLLTATSVVIPSSLGGRLGDMAVRHDQLFGNWTTRKQIGFHQPRSLSIRLRASLTACSCLRVYDPCCGLRTLVDTAGETVYSIVLQAAVPQWRGRVSARGRRCSICPGLAGPDDRATGNNHRKYIPTRYTVPHCLKQGTHAFC